MTPKDIIKQLNLPGINTMRFTICSVLGFAFIVAYDYLLHVKLLRHFYEMTPDLWRSANEMLTYFPFMMLTQFFTAFVVVLIFTQNYERKGVLEGVRYGILVGLLMGMVMISPFAWTPIPPGLAIAWFLVGLGKGIGLGVICSLLYRPAQ